MISSFQETTPFYLSKTSGEVEKRFKKDKREDFFPWQQASGGRSAFGKGIVNVNAMHKLLGQRMSLGGYGMGRISWLADDYGRAVRRACLLLKSVKKFTIMQEYYKYDNYAIK